MKGQNILLRNKYLEFICKNVFVKINDKNNTYFKNINNDVLELHIAHNENVTQDIIRASFRTLFMFQKHD